MAGRKSTADQGTTARCFVGGYMLVVGGAGFQINFYPPRKSTNDTKLESCCPECHTAHPDQPGLKTEVFHHCPQGHGPFKYADVVRATKDDEGDLRVIGTVDEVKQVKGVNDDPESDEEEDKTFELVAHLASTVEDQTYPSGTPYVLRPVPGSPTALFPSFLQKLGHDGHFKVGTGKAAKEYILIGEVTLKGTRKLMQLRTWNSQLVAQELIWFEDVHTFEPVVAKNDSRFAALVDKSFDNAIEEFDVTRYTNEGRKRLAEFAAARLADQDAVVIPMPKRAEMPVAQDDDAMFLALQASVDAVEKAKSKSA